MDNCSVCLNETDHHLECSHYTCFQCVRKLIKKKHFTCPICRKEYDPELYKYICKFTPTLKISKNRKNKFNSFLRKRYFLTPCKKQKLYRNLMYIHANNFRILNTYINLEENFFTMSKRKLLMIYTEFQRKDCLYSFVHHCFISELIEMILIN